MHVCMYFRRGVQSKQPTRKSHAGEWQGTVHSVVVFLQYRLTALHSAELSIERSDGNSSQPLSWQHSNSMEILRSAHMADKRSCFFTYL